ncbi:double-stranded DNA binding [Striga asiatica]|uniref:Double-stranded DNA binding n=1 Tax=Striga asiatica TaxID=4170 RepID=A0A5A7R1E6_STRAF|nr:double-stranded DNA binding [Striga asiatica]
MWSATEMAYGTVESEISGGWMVAAATGDVGDGVFNDGDLELNSSGSERGSTWRTFSGGRRSSACRQKSERRQRREVRLRCDGGGRDLMMEIGASAKFIIS